MNFSMEMFWVCIVVFSVLAEIVTVGLVAIWMTGGALLAFIVASLGGTLEMQIVAFFAATLALLYWTRPFAIKFINKKKVRTNVEETIGESARVIERIDASSDSGRVNYKGMEWTARADSEDLIIEEGEQVIIKEIRGVTMIVAKA